MLGGFVEELVDGDRVIVSVPEDVEIYDPATEFASEGSDDGGL